MPKPEPQPLRTLPERAFRARARLVAALLCCVCFAGLAARLAYLQLFTGSWYTSRALGQQLRDTVVPADRGRIYSADGALLAANSSCWTLRASPREMPEEKLRLAADGLAEILELDKAALLEKFSDRRSNDCLLRYRVERDTADRVRDFCEANGITGIRINQDSKRWYPQGEFLASVLGFTNVDNAGVSGLELKYNEVLTGQNGVVLTAVNAWGYTLEQSYETERVPLEGSGLRLTIDAIIQHYLENALTYAVRGAPCGGTGCGHRDGGEHRGGAGHVHHPCLRPQPAPRHLRRRRPAEGGRALRQRARGGTATGPADPVAQQSRQRPVRAGQRVQAHHLCRRAGCRGCEPPFHLLLRGLHLGGRHPVPLCQSQAPRQPDRDAGAGKLLQPELYPDRGQAGQGSLLRLFCRFWPAGAHRHRPARRTKKSLYYTADRMGPVELASCAFGQSSKISYMEMAAAVCAVVNGGKLMQPYLVSDILNPDGSVLQHIDPVCRRQVIRPETSRIMRGMMEAVVQNGGGRYAQIRGYRVGGKSGTSQKLDSADEKARIASFVAVAPSMTRSFCVWSVWMSPTAGPLPAAVFRPPCAPRCWNRRWCTKVSPRRRAGSRCRSRPDRRRPARRR